MTRLLKKSSRGGAIDLGDLGVVPGLRLVGAVLGVLLLAFELTKEGARVETLGPELRLAAEGDLDLLSGWMIALVAFKALSLPSLLLAPLMRERFSCLSS